MSFLETIFARLARHGDVPVLAEIRDGHIMPVTGEELLALVARARTFVRATGLRSGDRCALFAPNGIRWVALDLALMAEGIVVVPLYTRQAPAELAKIVQDAAPSLICCGDAALLDALRSAAPQLPRAVLLDAVFDVRVTLSAAPPPSLSSTAEATVVTIIYTSGTSGAAKGVMLTAGNVGHMLSCTTTWFDRLRNTPDAARVFHYLPFSFAASWILLLTALARNTYLLLSTDLNKLPQEMQAARAHYLLNVPILLERMRAQIEQRVAQTGGLGAWLFARGRAAWVRRHQQESGWFDALWLVAARRAVFRRIRAGLGANLEALICGSAPLALDTQLFFMMLGIPVLQVYGLTETTAICTMDVPDAVTPGRVGHAIPGIEMCLGDGGEILVRGPHVFAGYWGRAEESAAAVSAGWFHTGDQGAMDAAGNWSVVGRLKSLIILNSGHNIAPEPLEEMLLRTLPGAQQVILLGNNRSFLAALITGAVRAKAVQAAIDALNNQQPHYKQIRAFRAGLEPFTNENGLLTANGKLRRDAITAHYAGEIEAMCRQARASEMSTARTEVARQG